MAGPGFTQVFGGQTIYPSQTSYLPLNIAANTILQWPIEQSSGGAPIVADLMDVTAAAGLSIFFSDARQVSTGYTALLNNVGVNTFSLKDTGGNVLAAIASGQAWLVYLADNSTANGTWRVFQFGAGVSNANAAALAGAGLKAIVTTLNERIAISSQAANYAIVDSDRASCIEWTGGNGVLTSPDPAVVGADWFCLIKNNGSGNATFTPVAGTVDGSATLVMAPDASAFILCDGANFFTVGLGQQLNSIFDFVSIDVSGAAGDVVLAGATLNRISYRFTGALTGNRNIIVPTVIQQYWADNETTGAFPLTVKTAAGAGVTINQGSRNILYCDGVNVVPAVTFSATGFLNGSAVAPSINFTASPSTGFYSPAANSLAATSNGVQRWGVSATGHHTFVVPDDSASPTSVFNAAVNAIGVQVASTFSSGSLAPLLSLISTAAGGFATFSLSGNGVVGTDDFALLQNGVNKDGTLINRHATANLHLVAGGSVDITCSGVTVATFSPTATNVTIGVGASADAIGFRTLTQTTIGAAGGASALPATPLGYMTVLVNGAAVKIPYYNP